MSKNLFERAMSGAPVDTDEPDAKRARVELRAPQGDNSRTIGHLLPPMISRFKPKNPMSIRYGDGDYTSVVSNERTKRHFPVTLPAVSGICTPKYESRGVAYAGVGYADIGEPLPMPGTPMEGLGPPIAIGVSKRNETMYMDYVPGIKATAAAETGRVHERLSKLSMVEFAPDVKVPEYAVLGGVSALFHMPSFVDAGSQCAIESPKDTIEVSIGDTIEVSIGADYNPSLSEQRRPSPTPAPLSNAFGCYVLPVNSSNQAIPVVRISGCRAYGKEMKNISLTVAHRSKTKQIAVSVDMLEAAGVCVADVETADMVLVVEAKPPRTNAYNANEASLSVAGIILCDTGRPDILLQSEPLKAGFNRFVYSTGTTANVYGASAERIVRTKSRQVGIGAARCSFGGTLNLDAKRVGDNALQFWKMATPKPLTALGLDAATATVVGKAVMGTSQVDLAKAMEEAHSKRGSRSPDTLEGWIGKLKGQKGADVLGPATALAVLYAVELASNGSLAPTAGRALLCEFNPRVQGFEEVPDADDEQVGNDLSDEEGDAPGPEGPEDEAPGNDD